MLATIPAATLYGAVISAVAHRQFVGLSEDNWRKFLEEEDVLLDLKSVMPRVCSPCASESFRIQSDRLPLLFEL